MSTLDEPQEAVDSYVTRLAALRQSRRSHFAELIETVSAVDWDLDALETKLHALRSRFNGVRPGGRVRFHLRWHPSRRSSAGLIHHGVGLEVLASDQSAPRQTRRLKAWPRSIELDRTTHPADRAYRRDVIKEIKVLNRTFIRDRSWLYQLGNAVRKIASDNSLEVLPIAPTRNDLTFDAACHYRAAISAHVIRVIKALLEQMESIDRELTKVMYEFNTVEPKRRNGSLSIAFTIRGTQMEQRVGPNGPFFSTVSFKNGRRYAHRLKSGSKRFPNRVNRDVLRSRHLRRYARPLLLKARRIEQLRNKRAECQAAAESLYRHIRTMQRELK